MLWTEGDRYRGVPGFFVVFVFTVLYTSFELEERVTMKKFVLYLFIVAALPLLAGAAMAGELDQGLVNWLADHPDTAYEKVLLRLTDQADITSLNHQLRQERATLGLRHQQVIQNLQAIAAVTQPALLDHLEQREMSGDVRSFHPFWLSNLIAVEATPAEIKRLAGRADVETVYLDYVIELIKPTNLLEPKPMKGNEGRRTAGSRAVEPGIAAIKAPEAWALGFTGAGRLVAHLDTGVDGTHPTMAARWRGLSAPASECWFDPVTGTTFPFDAGYHGTHTMGTICGWSSSDEIGVAKDAQWISAGVIDRVSIPTTMSDAIAAFQWLVDPDGNPGTMDDVPDSIGNSWGISPIYHGSYITGPCDTTFWAAIDNCEAAGSAVIFSAGNEGSSGAASLRTPSDRADSPYNAYAVGSVDATNDSFPYPISYFSSRGPGCNNQIKPEVVAPGSDVRSAYPGGGFTLLSGTSMASPHVTGAVAVLRQVDPNLDVDTIKQILISTAVDLGPPGEDNTFGVGIIDLEQAVIAAGAGSDPTVSVNIACAPNSGTLPFVTQFTIDTTNLYSGGRRRVTVSLDVLTGGGRFFSNWRVRNMNVHPSDTRTFIFNQFIPNKPSSVGISTFTARALDVTPPPWNLPPHPVDGDMDSSSCTVEGIAP